MKKLPKVIPGHTPVMYRLRGQTKYGNHSPSCRRSKRWVEVLDGYDHEEQQFIKRKVTLKQLVALGEAARPPLKPADFQIVSKERHHIKGVELIKRRYPKNFQKRESESSAVLKGERQIEANFNSRELRSWLKRSEKNRNNSPLPPKDTPKPQPQVKRIVRKTARKRYHKAVSLAKLIGS